MESTRPPDAKSSSPAHDAETATLVDTGVLTIQEVRGPDQLPEGDKKLSTYIREGTEDIGLRTLPATTGDQVVFRIKEAPRSPTSDTAGTRDATGSHRQQLSPPRSVSGPGSSSSSTPRASGTQVAVLGSPQVPVGLSCALGYLHLGQVARVKVPPHLMEQAVTDIEGAMEDVHGPDAQQGSASSHNASGSQRQQGAAPGSTQQHAGGAQHPSDQRQQQQHQQEQQEQGDVASHPIDVVEAASKGSTPVHASHSSSPGAHHHHHRHRLLLHHSPAAAVVVTSDTVDVGGSSSSDSSAAPGHRRQFSDPKIIRPKGWLEQQQQSAAGMQSSTAAAAAQGKGSSRVAAAAAHAAAASSDDPIRRAVAATMGSKSPSPAAPAAPTAAAGGGRPSIGSIPEASSARFPARFGEPADAVPAAAAAGTAAAAAPSNIAFSAGSSTLLQSSRRSASPAFNRSPSPSPNAGGRSSSGFVRTADRNPNPASSSGPRGIAFSKLSPQPSAEGVPPATPHPSPAAPELLAGGGSPLGQGQAAARGGGGVRAVVSRLNQQQVGSGTANGSSSAGMATAAAGGASNRRASADSPTSLRSAGGLAGTAAAAAAGGARRASADNTTSLTSAGGLARAAGVSGSGAAAAAGGNRRSSDSSIPSSSNAGFSTPPASIGTPYYTPGGHTPQSVLSGNSDTDSTVGGSTVSSNSTAMSGTNQGSRQGPPPRSLLTLEGLPVSPRPGGAAAGGGSGMGSAGSTSSTTAGGGGQVWSSPKAAAAPGLAAVLPQQQQNQQQSGGGSRTAGSASRVVAEGGRAAAGDRTAVRELKFGSGAAVGAKTSPHGHESSAVLQAAADKLRTQFPTSATAADTGPGEEGGSSSNSDSDGARFAAAGQRDTAGVRDTGDFAAAAAAAAAGKRPSGEPQQTEDWGHASFAKWLPSGGNSSSTGKGSADIMAAAAAMAAAAKDADSAAGSSAATGAGPSSGPAAGTGSSSATSEAAAMAAALQPGFKPSFEHSSGRTVTQSSTGSAEGNYNLQNYPAARHSVESFGGVQAADGSAQGATATARSGGATAPTATPHVSAAAPAAAVGLAGAAGTEIKPAPARLVSPSKAAAASALSGYSAVQAGAPAVATTEPAAGQGRTGQHYKGSTALLDLQQLQGRAAVRTAAAAGAAGVPGSVSGVGTQGAPRGVYVGPIEHALMPGQQHTGFASARSSSSSADDRGVSLLAASPAAASKPPAAAVASSAAVDLTAVTELSEVLPAEGGVEGVESSAAAAAASGQSGPAGTAAAAAPAVRDDRVEYEVEVLGIIPGHGPLSGQPVLSEAAQQEQLTRADVKAAATAAASTEPQLQPPKPRKGFSGWVRQHLSLNVSAPWRAGKAGASAVGLRGCFGGKKGGMKAPQQGQQQPMYGTSGT